jgi:dihydrofolate reductase
LDGVDSAIACEPRVHDTPAPAASPSAPTSERRLDIIAAIAANGVIGVNGTLPWRIPGDLRRFRALTSGHSIIMGRKTWDSLGRPLPDRQNIVLSRRAGWSPAGATTASSLAEAIARAELPDPIFVIGGAELYRAALPIAEVMHLTEVQGEFAGDAHFPDYDRAAWHEVGRESARTAVEPPIAYDFVTYARNKA